MKLEDLVTASENDLYSFIGSDIIKGDLQGMPYTKLQLIERGKRWFIKHSDEIKKEVCSSSKIKDFATKEILDITLITAIADLISDAVIKVSPITVSVLICRKGLNVFCDTEWNYSNSQ